MLSPPLREDPNRPEFMAILGLLPPYTASDVKAAYRVKAMQTHPDRGGSSADFIKIHEAYKQATEYVQFTGDRRKWIAEQVESYLRQQEAAAEVEKRGGQTEFEEADWLKGYIGDFAQLVVRLRVIRLQDTTTDDTFLTFLAGPPPRAPHLVELSLAGARITDQGLPALTGLELLRRLDLSGTRVTARGVLAAVRSLPSLEWVGVAGLRFGWLSRWRLRALLRGREAERKRLNLLSPSS